MPHTLLQLTDLHLQADPATDLHGVNPEQRLRQLLPSLQQEEAAALVLSGDLAHGGNPAAYRRLQGYLATLPFPAWWLPGNHDDAALMRREARDTLRQKTLRLGNWRILLLDTSSAPDGIGGGGLAESELTWLGAQLDAVRDDSAIEHLLLVLHHHPVPVGSAWQDAIMLRNAARFWGMVAPCRKLRALLFGHVHQAQALTRNGVQLFSAPAVAAQFAPGCADFTLGAEGPAYARYRLHDGGRIEQALIRLELARP